MTTTAEFITEDAPQPKRDRWGRPTLRERDTTRRVAYTRPTTIAKTLSDQHNLMRWERRMTALGLAARPDLLAGVASTPADDKQTLDKLTDQAKEAAAASAAATTGTAIHKFVERVLRGNITIDDVGEPWRKQVAAIVTAIDDAGFTVEATEVFLVNEDIKAAGTADLILTHRDEPDIQLVGDLKTGASVQWGAHEWAVQLSIYSCSTHVYDWAKDVRVPHDWNLDLATGVIVHAHADQPVTVWRIDLAEGARALHHSLWTREWRSTKWDSLLTPWADPVAPQPVVAGTWPTEAVHDWLVERIGGWPAEARKRLAAAWPAGLPTFKQLPTGTTHEPGQQQTLEALCDRIEGDLQLPFGASRPRPTPTNEGDNGK